MMIDVLSLGPHVEVIEPVELRRAVAERARQTAMLYIDPIAQGDEIR